ncbi:hypothetical protein Nmel_001178, partial [Mimus melanotis]
PQRQRRVHHQPLRAAQPQVRVQEEHGRARCSLLLRRLLHGRCRAVACAARQPRWDTSAFLPFLPGLPARPARRAAPLLPDAPLPAVPRRPGRCARSGRDRVVTGGSGLGRPPPSERGSDKGPVLLRHYPGKPRGPGCAARGRSLTRAGTWPERL